MQCVKNNVISLKNWFACTVICIKYETSQRISKLRVLQIGVYIVRYSFTPFLLPDYVLSFLPYPKLMMLFGVL